MNGDGRGDSFNGLGMHLGNLSWTSPARSRSISAENPTGGKNAGGRAAARPDGPSRELGLGWKTSPSILIEPGETYTLAEIDGPGAITHIWMTLEESLWRRVIIRMYWDHEDTPSVEVPLGDFFANGWCRHCQINSIPVAVNPKGGFNCYWEMPFRTHARMTVETLGDEPLNALFYQIDYVETEIPEQAAYFHAQWRRSNPVPYGKVHTILDEVHGTGQYVGTYLAWGANSSGWWGEGEVKFYLDGDTWPTICTTGTEDYFGGAWAFEYPAGEYGTYSTPYLGMPQVIEPAGFFDNQQRFGLYRWHIQDPIRFAEDLRVDVQALGWRRGGRFLPLQDDLASTAFWYQHEPHAAFPEMGTANDLEVI